MMARLGLVATLVACLTLGVVSQDTHDTQKVQEAVDLLESYGVPLDRICTTWQLDSEVPLPSCELAASANVEDVWSSVRSLEEEYVDRDEWFYVTHIISTILCVMVAALAAGLTMGLLSLDPLLLLIKMRAGSTKEERDQAAALLPIVKQHHLLLVTLLLLNSMANEALPLFLEVLVSPVVAVVLSVTLVLFFGEIIPSAVFTGPDQIAIASRLVPLVRLVMFLLLPISFPIAKMLDMFLHHDDDEGGDAFNRGELSALVRIQYEERMASKQRNKEVKASFRRKQSTDVIDNVGGIDFGTRSTIKAAKKDVERRQSSLSNLPSETTMMRSWTADETSTSNLPDEPVSKDTATRTASIHMDEVSMVEGALSMKTKVALDVYTPIHRMFAISYDMLLNEANVVNIYSSGFSRIPVFRPNPKKPKSSASICGILMTKQLIVVSPTEQRPLSTLPLQTPKCISPKMNLVDLLNMFQTGKVGHLALVCARPLVAQRSLLAGEAVSEEAGLMGIITLEDILEALLQEQIYDESDKLEKEELRLAQWAALKWRIFVNRRKREREARGSEGRNLPSLEDVVDQAVTAAASNPNEESRLLPGPNNARESATQGGLLGFFERFSSRGN